VGGVGGGGRGGEPGGGGRGGFLFKNFMRPPGGAGLELLDRGSPTGARARSDRGDPRAGLADARGLPAHEVAQIAETVLAGRRLIVRRVRTLDAQGELLPSWEHYPFVTNREAALAVVEAEHRQHAVVELTIRDLKDQALAHFPSGKFFANAAWSVIACLAHNLLRWTGVIGLPGQIVRTARTLRRRLLALPGRLTKSARRFTLHLPARWPWQHDFIEALTRIRALAAVA
jgi:hypothetical protein